MHFAERDDALGFLEVPLLHLILPTVYRTEKVSSKLSIFFIISCMPMLINWSEVESEKGFSRHAIYSFLRNR